MYIHWNKYTGSFLFIGSYVSDRLYEERPWITTLPVLLFNLLFHYYLHEARDFLLPGDAHDIREKPGRY